MTAYRKARGAVVQYAGGPIEVVDIHVPLPDRSEVLIKVEACGLCHSDIHFAEGTSGQDFPYLLGHEVVGFVENVGSEVINVKVGDRVVVALMVPCRNCLRCKRDEGQYCPYKMKPATPPRLIDGQALTPVLLCGGLATHVTVQAQHVMLVSDSIPGSTAALLGCGVPTGFGAATNTGAVDKDDQVLVLGAGGVGLAAIAGAKTAGSKRIAVADLVPEKLDLAREFGATEVYNPSVDTVPSGFDVVIDAVGGATILSTAIDLAGYGGRIVICGAPATNENAEFSLREAFMKRVTIIYSHWGDFEPNRDLQVLSTVIENGSFPVERYVSETVLFSENVGEHYRRLKAGEVLRSVILMQ